MNRRGFIGSLFGVVAGVVLEQAIPLGRVWSFPKEIVVPAPVVTLEEAFGAGGNVFLQTEWITAETLRSLKSNLRYFDEIFREHERDRAFLAGDRWPVGETLQVRFPQRFVVDDVEDEFAGIDDVNEYD